MFFEPFINFQYFLAQVTNSPRVGSPYGHVRSPQPGFQQPQGVPRDQFMPQHNRQGRVQQGYYPQSGYQVFIYVKMLDYYNINCKKPKNKLSNFV